MSSIRGKTQFTQVLCPYTLISAIIFEKTRFAQGLGPFTWYSSTISLTNSQDLNDISFHDIDLMWHGVWVEETTPKIN